MGKYILAMKKLILLLLLGIFLLAECSKNDLSYTPEIKPTKESIRITPTVDSCLLEVIPELDKFVYGEITNSEKLLELSRDCSEDLYMRIQWGIRMKETNILTDILFEYSSYIK